MSNMASTSITIITANFYPEDTAIGLYTTQFAQHLADIGMEVTVLTGFPYYPAWKISENYTSKPDGFEEYLGKIRIVRTRQFVPSKVTVVSRLRMIGSFVRGINRNLSKISASDLVICIIPFTFSVFPARRLAKKLNAPLWIHVQDFEFDLAVESGILNKSRFFSGTFATMIYKLERQLLDSAYIVSSISNGMLRKIGQKSRHQDSYFFPNWVSSEKIDPLGFNRHPLLDQRKFNLLYSGNIGEKQDWAFLIRLCETIETDPEKPGDVEIVIVGSGGFSNELKKMISRFPFVKLYPPVPYEELGDLLCSADVHFLFQKTEIIDTLMPSKILGMMASARPSVITGNTDSEVKMVMDRSGGGFYFAENNASTAWRKIIELRNNPEQMIKMGMDARKYVLEQFSEKAILTNFHNKVQSVIDENLKS